MHCFSKSLIVIRRYPHFTHRAANHCCQSLSRIDNIPFAHSIEQQISNETDIKYENTFSKLSAKSQREYIHVHTFVLCDGVKGFSDG